jgi:hypothetical protein
MSRKLFNDEHYQMGDNIEDNIALNSIYLLLIILNFKKCNLEQAAISLYLLRFSNIFVSLLNNEDTDKYLSLCTHSELNNLDSMLSPYLLSIYNDRFHFALKELLARDIIIVEQTEEFAINMNKNYLESTILTIPEVGTINKKIVFIVHFVERASIFELKDKIHKLTGDLNVQ